MMDHSLDVSVAATGLQMRGLRASIPLTQGPDAPGDAQSIAPTQSRAEAQPVRLLLIHGWPEWSQAWVPLVQRLVTQWAGQFPNGLELIAPDLRGFGDTEPAVMHPARDAGPDRHAADLLALADQLSWQQFGIVSHDVGSFVAQAIARQAPQRVNRLFFFNCAYPGIGARWVDPRHLPEIWYQFFHQLPWAAELVGSSPQACRLYLRHFLEHWSHQHGWIDAALDAWVRQFMKPGRIQGGMNWYGSVHEARLAVIEGRTAALAPIVVPTQVLWGAHDPVLKAAWADRLGEFFSDVRVQIQPDAGHFVHLELPDLAAQAVAAFFSSLPAVSSAPAPRQ